MTYNALLLKVVITVPKFRFETSPTERMGKPRRARAGLEGDACAAYAGGVRRFEERINAHCAREPIRGAFRRGLQPSSFDIHVRAPILMEASLPHAGARSIDSEFPMCSNGSTELSNAR